MKPTEFSNLSPEDAGIIFELSPKIEITAAERLAKALTDKKFYIETAHGEKRLLVIHTTEHYDWLEGDFRMCEYIAASGINVMRPVSMGTFRNEAMAYQLYTWYDGEDLEGALAHMSPAEQSAAGEKTGELLRKLHALPPFEEDETEPWGVRFKRRTQNAIQSYNDNPVKTQGADLLVRYLQDNQGLLENRPQTFTHGDCNAGNLMFCEDGQIGVIDLGWGNNYNDPWWDFKEMTFPNSLPAHFLTSQIKAYFDGEPPLVFFRLLAYYVAYGALESLRDLSRADYLEEIRIALIMFDDMRNPVPSWYLSQAIATHDD